MTKEYMDSTYIGNSLHKAIVDKYIAEIATLTAKLKAAEEALKEYADKSLWPSSSEYDGNSWHTAEHALEAIRSGK